MFEPDYTPREMFEMGIFGGTYFRPIYSSINKTHYELMANEFDFLKDIPKEKVSSSKYNNDINYYKEKSGLSLATWERNGWIHPEDPYGWIQWYCRYYNGRRIEEEDQRQIRRHNLFKKRFLSQKNLSNREKQALLQWAIDWNKQ